MPVAVQVQSSAVICFGKLPTHGDFVRHNAHGGSVRALDDWLQRGMYFAKEHGTRCAGANEDGAGPIPFVFSPPNDPKVLAGVIRPSRDRVGRRYPFLVAMELDRSHGEARVAAQLPLNAKGFLEWSAAVAEHAVSGEVDYRDLSRHLEQSPPPSRLTGGLAEGEAYLKQTTFRQFSERLWGSFEDTRKYRLFKNLLDIVLPLEHNLPATFPLGLRFPLCGDGRFAAGDVSFWMDVCWHLLKLPFATPTFFWTLEAGNRTDEPPCLLVFLRQPGPPALAYLLGDVADHDHVCNLEHMGRESAADVALAIPVRYGRLLEDGDISLRDFLSAL